MNSDARLPAHSFRLAACGGMLPARGVAFRGVPGGGIGWTRSGAGGGCGGLAPPPRLLKDKTLLKRANADKLGKLAGSESESESLWVPGLAARQYGTGR